MSTVRGLTSAWAHGAAGGRPETRVGEKNGLEGTSPAWNTWGGGEGSYRRLSSLDLAVPQPPPKPPGSSSPL